MPSWVDVVRVAVAAVIVFFVPGYVWSYVFFPRPRPLGSPGPSRGLDILERLAVGFALSMAVVTLGVLAVGGVIRHELDTPGALALLALVIFAPVPLLFRRRLWFFARVVPHGNGPGSDADENDSDESQADPIRQV